MRKSRGALVLALCVCMLMVVGCGFEETPSGPQLVASGDGSSIDYDYYETGDQNQGDKNECPGEEPKEEECFSEPSGTPIDCDTGEPI